MLRLSSKCSNQRYFWIVYAFFLSLNFACAHPQESKLTGSLTTDSAEGETLVAEVTTVSNQIYQLIETANGDLFGHNSTTTSTVENIQNGKANAGGETTTDDKEDVKNDVSTRWTRDTYTLICVLVFLLLGLLAMYCYVEFKEIKTGTPPMEIPVLYCVKICS